MMRTAVPLPVPLAVPRDVLRDGPAAGRLEWLETDGQGGYAAGTAACANTRRYHGLVVTARHPPADRVVLLSRFEETLVLPGGERFDLGAAFYPGVIHPRGFRYLESFALDPWPVWRYAVSGAELVRELFISRAAGATVVRYRIAGTAARLELRPLVAGRDHHALTSANAAIRPRAEVSERLVAYQPYDGLPTLVLSFLDGEWSDIGDWYYRALYPRDAERGLTDREDLFCPGVLTVPLEPARTTVVACGTRPARVANARAWVADELRRRGAIAETGRFAAGAGPAGELGARLALAGDTFVVDRHGGRSIVAGYPWFVDWARDAMIALPGLCIETGRLSDAAAVLRSFAAHLRDGLLPNRFPDAGGALPDSDYNAVDAPLWFIEAAARLADAGGAIDAFRPAIREILAAYERGTRFGIRMDADGLVTQGEPGVQLTWMDARADGAVITRRAGKAIEINALWYNALRRAESLATSRAAADGYRARADACQAAFETFWYEEGGYLYDVIDERGVPDAALRPNQLIALGLTHSPVPAARARRALEAVEQQLLVPIAVRTLAPGNPGYHGKFDGALPELDRAYHNGAAWPWLIGPYAAAVLRVGNASAEACARVESLLLEFDAHLQTYGLGQVAEVLAGDPPHRPGGCFAQAWSCAEPLRMLAELRHARLMPRHAAAPWREA